MFIITSLWTILADGKGEVHCYCNSPRCSSSNYMCKSQIGCYSFLVDHKGNTNDPYLHGCIESITLEKCEEISRLNNGTTDVPSETSSQYQELSCCFESMCNFKDEAEVKNSADTLDNQYMNEPYEAVSEQAIWFRAAVIAVPIAGACILIGLIMVAARMLRSEDKQFTKLSVNVRQRAALRTHSARNSTIHRTPQFLENSRVKNINITGNKLVDPFVGRPNKINNMNNMSKVTNELLHQQRCVNECPRLISTQHYEKMYRENFDVV
ncbi:BMP and activin membrane-bound inhibitor homolog isoform X2 [Acanthaster planci]|uniref:BMP and activin membrane-bound inhibitor homolog isoform X2 n=1 Tax=Acanthaster planci TaxID=133434 RepID=A0A8B7Z6T8_ACAPL|nr:BMP and activin membrane-bound inhibitor homolog isoform X2 [Acanthaster planci]